MACLQRMEEQFDQFEIMGTQIGALTEQFAIKGDPNRRRCQPNSHFLGLDFLDPHQGQRSPIHSCRPIKQPITKANSIYRSPILFSPSPTKANV
jgi:hypothetical protein